LFWKNVIHDYLEVTYYVLCPTILKKCHKKHHTSSTGSFKFITFNSKRTSRIVISIHLTGKTTKKRQNSSPSTPPAHA
jgi:hypothetical protein